MQPIREYILIEKKENEKIINGVVLDSKERQNSGLVLEVGIKVQEVEKGNTVYFSNYKEVENYLLIKEEDVLCIKK